MNITDLSMNIAELPVNFTEYGIFSKILIKQAFL